MSQDKRKYFKDEDIKSLRTVNILDYLKAKGYVLEKKGNSYKLPGEGGLYVSSDGSKWNCFSSRQGGGIIQLIMHIERCSWYECLVKLDEFKNGYVGVDNTPTKSTRNIEEPLEKKLILPDKNKDYKRIYAYLIQTRKIDSDVVNKFVHDKKLYQNTKGSCVFVGYSEGNMAKYASWRATSGGLRGDCPGSDKSYPFVKEGSNNILKVVEAPIELLSLYNMDKACNMSDITECYKSEFEYKNNHYLSLGGLCSGGLDNYLVAHPEIEQIEFCFNDDSEAKENWGQNAAIHFKELYGADYNCSIRKPIGNDFNEELVFIKPFLNAPSFPGKTLEEVKGICAKVRDEPPLEVIEKMVENLKFEKFCDDINDEMEMEM